MATRWTRDMTAALRPRVLPHLLPSHLRRRKKIRIDSRSKINSRRGSGRLSKRRNTQHAQTMVAVWYQSWSSFSRTMLWVRTERQGPLALHLLGWGVLWRRLLRRRALKPLTRGRRLTRRGDDKMLPAIDSTENSIFGARSNRGADSKLCSCVFRTAEGIPCLVLSSPAERQQDNGMYWMQMHLQTAFSQGYPGSDRPHPSLFATVLSSPPPSRPTTSSAACARLGDASLRTTA